MVLVARDALLPESDSVRLLQSDGALFWGQWSPNHNEGGYRWRGGHGKMEGFDHWHCENWLWCSTNDIVSRLQFPHLESASLEMDSVATECCLFHSIYPLEFIFTFSISAPDDMTPLCCGVVTCCVTLISNISVIVVPSFLLVLL